MRLFFEFLFDKLDKSKVLSCSSQDVFHPLHWCCLHPPLDALEHLNILFIWWGPELHKGPKVEAAPMLTTAGQSSFLFGYAVFDAPRMGIALSAGSYWAAVNNHPQIPFCRAATPPYQVKNPVIVFVTFCPINHCLMLQSIWAPSAMPLISQDN